MYLAKRLTAFFLCLCMVISMLPAPVFAEENIIIAETVPETTAAAVAEETVSDTTAAVTEPEETAPETTAAVTEPEETVPETTAAAAEPEDTIPETTPGETTPSQTLQAGELEVSYPESFAFSGSGTYGSPYLITSEADLRELASKVSAGNSYSGVYFRLTSGFTFTESWTPIGTEEYPFCGTFDGNGQTLSGLTATGNYIGLFGYVGGGATIQNLTLSDVNLDGGLYVAGLAAFVDAGSGQVVISDCSVSGTIDGAEDDEDGDECGRYTGAIAAYVTANTGAVAIRNCCSNADIICDNYAGGIIGQAAVENGSLLIDHCTNHSLVRGGNNAYYCGGIVGNLSGGTVKHCMNYGNVSGNAYSDDNGSGYFGGIAGAAHGTTFTACGNFGALSAFFVGGISAEGNSSFDNCISKGSLSYSSDGWGYAIGPTNYVSSSFTNCYATSGTTATGITDVITSDFTSGCVAYNTSAYFGQTLGTDTYPVPLTDTNRVYKVTITGVVSGTCYANAGRTISLPAPTTNVRYLSGSTVFTESSTVTGDMTLTASCVKHSFSEGICIYCRETAGVFSGTCGDNLTWTLDEATGTLSIAGTGRMDDGVMPWEGYSDLVTDVQIAEGVTYLAENAFLDFTHLETVFIPYTMEEIGNFAFSGCTGLLTIRFEGDAPIFGIDIFYDVTAVAQYPSSGSGWAEAVQDSYGGSIAWTAVKPTVGSCGEDLLWRFDAATGTLTISGTGAMADYTEETPPAWLLHDGDLTTLVVEEGVTSIGDFAFFMGYLSDFTLPESLQSIGSYAFFGCYDLPSAVVLPDSVTSIGEGAFAHCESMASIDLGAGCSEIGAVAFYYCSALKEITIPASVTEIGSRAFDCSGLETITFLGDPPAIASDAFLNRTLTAMYPSGSTTWTESHTQNYGGTVTWMMEYPAMGSCGENLSWTLTEEGVLTISGSGTMTNYTEETRPGWAVYEENVKQLVVEEGVTSIGDFAFFMSYLSDFTLPESLLSIGSYAFFGCYDLPSAVVLPDSVTKIGEGAFAHCESTSSITLGENCSEIGTAAFYYCTALKQITIPASVTKIGSRAFDCSGLETITFLGEPPVIASDAFLNRTLTARYPADIDGWNAAMGNYGGTVTWTPKSIGEGTCGTGLTWVLDHKGVLTVSGSGAMTAFATETDVPWYAYRERILTVSIGDGVTGIGSYAFQGCTNLTGISISDSVYSVGSSAFRGCSKLTSVTLPDEIGQIPDYLFADCTALTAVTLPEEYYSIGSNAFQNCTALTAVELPETLTTIGSYAFDGCSGLTAIAIPESAVNIGSSAFSGCSGLTEIVLPDNLAKISSNLLKNCTGLTQITIPEPVTMVGSGAFEGCSSLRSVRFLGQAPTIGSTAFNGITTTVYYPEGSIWLESHFLDYGGNLTWVALPTGSCGSNLRWALEASGTLTISGSGAMTDFTADNTAPWYQKNGEITAIVVEEGVISIGDYAFADCAAVTEITLPGSVSVIGSNAFGGCTGLKKVVFTGDAPAIVDNAFAGDSLNLFYPAGNTTWTEDKRQSYGGSVTWIPYTHEFELDFLARGICGENVSWGITEDYVLHIYGSGPMTDYTTASDIPWYSDYKSLITAAVVGENVTTVGSRTFYYLSNMTAVSLPDSLTALGSYAFAYCSSLRSVAIPENVTVLPERALAYCDGLTEVTLPETLTTIGNYAFYSSDNLAAVSIPAGVTAIGTGAFYGTAITGITLPEGITAIEANTFYNCTSLESITIPAGVASVGNSAFRSCSKLTQVTFTGSEPTFGTNVFQGVTAEVRYPAGWSDDVLLPYGGSITWTPYCTGAHTIVTLPGTAATCTEPGITEGSYCSACGTVLAEQTEIAALGHAMNSDRYCFRCGLGDGDFGEGLSWHFDAVSGKLTISGSGTMKDYNGTGAPWYLISSDVKQLVIEEGITHIGSWAFYGLPITSVTIPEGVVTIGVDAFGYCTKLTTVNLSDTVTQIRGWAFSGCSALASITMSQQLTSIGSYAFENCTALTTVTFPESFRTFGDKAFVNCNNLRTITFTGDAPTFSSESFLNCGPTVYYPGYNETWTADTMQSYGGYPKWTCSDCVSGHTAVTDPAVDATCIQSGLTAGSHCAACRTVITAQQEVPATGTHNFVNDVCEDCGLIGGNGSPSWTLDADGTLTITATGKLYNYVSWANYRADIKTVVFSDGITELDGDYFYHFENSQGTGYNNITRVVFPESLTRIGSSMFQGCTGLAEADLPSGLTHIANGAFSKTALTEVTIPAGVTYIGTGAYSSCSQLKTVRFEGSAPEFGSDPFHSCTLTAYYPYGDSSWNSNVRCDYGGSITWVPYSTGDSISSGSCGDSLLWELDSNGILWITGSGSMTDYTVEAPAPWSGSEVKTVYIADTVTGIGSRAFAGCTALTDIDFAGEAPAIAEDAFTGCTANAHYYTGSDAWEAAVQSSYCGSITWQPRYVASGTCGPDAYWNLDACGILRVTGSGDLTYVTDENGDVFADWYLFVPQIREIIFGENIGDFSESYYTNGTYPLLTKITLLGSSTTGSFDGMMPALEAIVVPDDHTAYAVRNGVLYSKDGTTLIRYPGSRSGSREFVIGDGVTTLSSYAFESCTVLDRVTIPASVTEIGRWAFRYSSIPEFVFRGDAPATISTYPMMGLTATAYYPEGNTTWTEAVMKKFGSSITWVPYSGCDLGHSFADGVCSVCSEAQTSGSCGENLTWSFDTATGALTISGEGTMNSYSSTSPAPWNHLVSGILSITIEDGTSSIGSRAFADCSAVTSVSIADSVLSAGAWAFYNCTSLTQISLPDHWTELSNYLFNGCTALRTVNLPTALTAIGNYTFGGCYSLNSIVIPEGVTHIGSSAFSWCGAQTSYGAYYDANNFVSVTLPSTLVSIGDYAFYRCESLTGITVPDQVTTIGNYAFAYCYRLTNAVISASIETIGDHGFFQNKVLKTMTFNGNAPTFLTDSLGANTMTCYYPAWNTTWTTNVFQNYGGTISWVPYGAVSGTCGENLTWNFDTATGTLTISGEGAMEDYSLSADNTPWAYYSDSITKVVLEEGVTRIGDAAFKNCTALTAMEIPASITQLGEAVAPQGQPIRVTVNQTVRQWSTVSIGAQNEYFPHWDCTTFVNEAPIVASGRSGEQVYWELNEEGTMEFFGTGEMYSFGATSSPYFHLSAKSVVFTEGITSIGECIFEVIDGDPLSQTLESVTIADGVETIGVQAFTNCKALKTITFEGSAPAIANDSFTNVTATAYYPAADRSWDLVRRNYGGTLIWEPYGPNEGTCGDDLRWVFDEATGTLTISGTGPMYDDYYDATVMDETVSPWRHLTDRIIHVVVEDGVTYVEEYIFYTYPNLESITIADSVTEIGMAAFGWNPRLTQVKLPGSITAIPDFCLIACEALTEVTIPDSVTTIGHSAFLGCSKLNQVALPKNLSRIEGYAFRECTSLTAMTMPAGVSYIGEYAFSGSTVQTITFTGNAPELVPVQDVEEGISPSGTFTGTESPLTVYYPAGDSSWDSVITGNYGGNVTWIPYGICGDDLRWVFDEATGTLTISGTGRMDDYTDSYAPWYDLRSGITNLVLEEGITYLGANAFLRCSNLTELSLPGTLKETGDYAFAHCTGLTEVVLPDTLETIGRYLFSRCSNLTTVTIGSGITCLSEGAFSHTGITAIVIPDMVKSLDSYVFEGCSALTELTIPASVNSMGSFVIYDSGVKTVTFEGAAPGMQEMVWEENSEEGTFAGTSVTVRYPVQEANWEDYACYAYGPDVTWLPYGTRTDVCGIQASWEFNADTGVLRIFGKNEMHDYREGEAPWQYLFLYIREIQVEEGITSVGSYAFAECDRFTALTLPETLTHIGSSAFACCTLTELEIPAAVTVIEEYAFYSCFNLQKVTFHGNAPDIADSAFAGVTATVYYPAGDSSWDSVVDKNYGGEITWVAEGAAEVMPTFARSMQAFLTLESVVYLNVAFTFDNLSELDIALMEGRTGLLIWDADAMPEEAYATYDNCYTILEGAAYNSEKSRFEARTEGIPAKELGDTICFRPFYRCEDGSYLYGRIISGYSPKQYCYNKLSDTDTADDAVMVAILNYGAAAQNYFGYHTDNLMNSGLSAEQQALNWDGSLVRSDWSIPAAKEGDLVRNSAVVTSRGAYLSLLGAIDYNYYAKVSDAVSVAEAKMLIWTEDAYKNAAVLSAGNATLIADMEYVAEKGRYEYTYEGLAAKAMFKPVYACAMITDSEGNVSYSGVVAYCPERYGYINAGSSDAVTAVMAKRLVLYGDAARSYFG